jgi:hypothetical protein
MKNEKQRQPSTLEARALHCRSRAMYTNNLSKSFYIETSELNDYSINKGVIHNIMPIA